MPDVDRQRLVLLHSTLVRQDGATEAKVGTGYLVTGDLILTANHVIGVGTPTAIRSRLEQGATAWRNVDAQPVWQDIALDAALLRLTSPIDLPGRVEFGDSLFDDDQAWSSLAYPYAASQVQTDVREYKTAGLSGKLYAGGGGGQGLPDLDLSVDAPPDDGGWEGISGAPVLVQGKIAGVIKSTLFANRRLAAVPAPLLLADPLFRLAITTPWFRLPSGVLPAVVLTLDNANQQLAKIVEAAIKLGTREEPSLFGTAPTIVTLSLSDALSSPEHFLTLVQGICQASVLVVDMTDFTPGAMLVLGIRSVVRRGVTVLVTAALIDETVLSQHPFNIQESKLISFQGKNPINSALHPVNRIKDAISNGMRQMRHEAGYLDLPSYEGVRCAEPLSLENVLVLCSFHAEYKEHWQYLSEQLFLRSADKPPVRLIDLPSPRLVGQALYEAIRWTSLCIVDWTHWRPNVFFELGVRLACSDLGPVCLIEQGEMIEPAAGDPAQLPADDHITTQKRMLQRLFKPNAYRLNENPSSVFDKVLSESKSAAKILNIDREYILPNDVYVIATKFHDSSQDSALLLPYVDLMRLAQKVIGSDPQRSGASPFLFSSNLSYATEMRKSAAERYLAAWYYIRGRYTADQLQKHNKLRDDGRAIAETILQLLRMSQDQDHKRILPEIEAWIEWIDGII